MLPLFIRHSPKTPQTGEGVNSKLVDTPIGRLQLLATDTALCALNWAHQHSETNLPTANQTLVLNQAADELRRYFAGHLQTFTVPLAPAGTIFQQQVWSVLETIDWGTTCTYKTVADALSKPSAARAVGTAIGRNPLPIFIPCHRVVGSNGSLTGFSGGLSTKRELLALENNPRTFTLN